MCGRESSNGDGDWCIYVKNTFIDVPQEATFKPRHSRCKSTPGNYPLGSDLRAPLSAIETRGGPLETCLEDDFPSSWPGPPGTPGHQVRSVSGSATSALVADLRAVDPVYVPIPALAVAGSAVSEPSPAHSPQMSPPSNVPAAAGQGELSGGAALGTRRSQEDFGSAELSLSHEEAAASKGHDPSSQPLQSGILGSSCSSRSNSLGPTVATTAMSSSPTAAATAGEGPSALQQQQHQRHQQTSTDASPPRLAPAYVSFSAYSAGGAPTTTTMESSRESGAPLPPSHPPPPPLPPPPPPPPSGGGSGGSPGGAGNNHSHSHSHSTSHIKPNKYNKQNKHTGRESAPLPAEASTGTDASTDDLPPGSTSRTTVMIRGLPADFTRAVLEDLFEQEGFRGCYNFMYVPIDIASGSSFFYAFVNLISPEEAARFFQHFTGFKNWPVPCDKESAVEWSESMQGVGELADRYRNSPLMHESVPDSLKPAMYKDGLRIAFPEPTKPIRAPRVRPPSAKKAEKLVLMRAQQGPISRDHPV